MVPTLRLLSARANKPGKFLLHSSCIFLEPFHAAIYRLGVAVGDVNALGKLVDFGVEALGLGWGGGGGNERHFFKVLMKQTVVICVD